MPHALDALTPAQHQFLSKTLGVSISAPAEPGPLTPVWTQATSIANAQLVALLKALNATGFDIMKKVAQSGIDKLTDGPAAEVAKAVAAYDKTGADAAPALRNATKAMRAKLDSDRVIAALDSNPIGMPVSLRATFGSALDRIDAALG